MKALTVQQPWAWAIVELDKVENRSWSTSYRGPFAIHAGKTEDPDGFHDSAIEQAVSDASYFRDDPATYTARGAFVGVCELVDVHPATAACAEGPCAPFGWFGPERNFHWVFDRMRRLAEPVPCRGLQQLWTPPDEILEQLQAVTR
jgi:hypothetical protein